MMMLLMRNPIKTRYQNKTEKVIFGKHDRFICRCKIILKKAFKVLKKVKKVFCFALVFMAAFNKLIK